MWAVTFQDDSPVFAEDKRNGCDHLGETERRREAMTGQDLEDLDLAGLGRRGTSGGACGGSARERGEKPGELGILEAHGKGSFQEKVMKSAKCHRKVKLRAEGNATGLHGGL